MLNVIRSIVEIMDDPHEFATAYVQHVESERAAGRRPESVTSAAQRFVRDGRL